MFYKHPVAAWNLLSHAVISHSCGMRVNNATVRAGLIVCMFFTNWYSSDRKEHVISHVSCGLGSHVHITATLEGTVYHIFILPFLQGTQGGVHVLLASILSLHKHLVK